MRTLLLLLLVCLGLGVNNVGCGDSEPSPSPLGADAVVDGVADAAAADALPDTEVDVAPDLPATEVAEDVALEVTFDVAPPPFAISSSAFEDGGVVPLPYECGAPVTEGPGNNTTPPLQWTQGPAETQSYAIVMVDETSGIVHWVVYDIPATTLAFPEDVPSGYSLNFPVAAKQGELQGSGYYGYLGPCSPGTNSNTYRWTLHAIGTETLQGATASSTEPELIQLIESQSLASTSVAARS